MAAFWGEARVEANKKSGAAPANLELEINRRFQAAGLASRQKTKLFCVFVACLEAPRLRIFPQSRMVKQA
jgi:hypothetical protein